MPSYLLLESGDHLLLESGDRVLLEDSTSSVTIGSTQWAIRGLTRRFAARRLSR